MRLLVFNAVLVAVIGAEVLVLGAGRSKPPRIARAPAAEPVEAVAPPERLRDGIEIEHIERAPIFFADRTAPIPAADDVDVTADEAVASVAAPESTEPPPADLTLLGTVVSDGITLALLSPPGAGIERAGVGEVVGGWWVDAIEPDRVRLRHSDTTTSVEITRGRSGRETGPVNRNYGTRQTPAPARGGNSESTARRSGATASRAGRPDRSGNRGAGSDDRRRTGGAVAANPFGGRGASGGNPGSSDGESGARPGSESASGDTGNGNGNGNASGSAGNGTNAGGPSGSGGNGSGAGPDTVAGISRGQTFNAEARQTSPDGQPQIDDMVRYIEEYDPATAPPPPPTKP